jgi:hypothetical protein
MDIKRCTKAFRSGGKGFTAGDLVPAAHTLVQAFPQFFESVEDYVTRKYPSYAADQAEATKTPSKAAPRRTPRKPEATP